MCPFQQTRRIFAVMYSRSRPSVPAVARLSLFSLMLASCTPRFIVRAEQPTLGVESRGECQLDWKDAARGVLAVAVYAPCTSDVPVHLKVFDADKLTALGSWDRQQVLPADDWAWLFSDEIVIPSGAKRLGFEVRASCGATGKRLAPGHGQCSLTPGPAE